MDNNKFNICISFSFKGKPYGLWFYTTASYQKFTSKKMDMKELYASNEPIVRGDIQL